MFGTRILTRFLMRRFFGGVGMVMLIVCGIIMAVTFVERLPSNPTVWAALGDAWMRLLEYLPLFLPLAIFMGTLLASYNLTKSSESVIVSSAGLSPYQSARPFLIGAAIIGFFATMVINPYSVYLGAEQISPDHLVLVDKHIWLRDGGDDGFITMNATAMQKSGDDLIFDNVTIFVQDASFKLIDRIEAAHVTLGTAGLASDNATVWNARGVARTGKWATETRLTPRTVLDRYLQPNQISFWALPGFIQKMSAVGVPVRGHRVQFWTLLLLPLTLVAMATLGVAFSQTHQRRNYSFGVKFSIGVITCFAVYFLTNIFNALGATGALPAVLAIAAPPLIIIAAAGVFIAGFDTL